MSSHAEREADERMAQRQAQGEADYRRYYLGEEPGTYGTSWTDDPYADGPEPDPVKEEEDPVCVCGTSLSEHTLCGCSEGFQPPANWEQEKKFIASLSDWEYEQIYGR